MTLKTGSTRIINLLQASFLRVYRLAVASGMLSTRWGRRMFEWVYMVYKNRFEATTVDGLRAFVKPGDSVIDVGANIGFFTLRFARWISEGGKVFALEPEPINFASLKRHISQATLADRVEAQQVAVADMTGEVYLDVDPGHPGNHQLGDTGLPMQAITLDALMAQHDWPRVGLIKVDVQGAEHRVIAGAVETIKRFHPVLFVEMDRDSTPRDLLRQIMDLGYAPHVLRKSAPPLPVTPEHTQQIVAASGYHDVLFIAAEQPGA